MESARKLDTVPYTEPRFNFLRQVTGINIGVLPLPLYLALAAIIYAASVLNKLPADMIGGFAVIIILGILLGHVGQNVPVLKDIGGPAILALFIPSAMIFFHWINQPTMQAVTTLMKTSNFLYFYIASLVAGSILGMNRKVLIQGFIRLVVPLTVGVITAITTGVLVGLLFGYSIYHTFFFIVIPIICGGIGEGILPLSLGYAEILKQSQSVFVSQMIPATLLGNMVAVICSGLLKRLGERHPQFSGNGTLVKSGKGNELLKEKNVEKPIDFSLMGVGLLLACSFYIFGNVAHTFIGMPGAIIMIFAAAIVKYFKVLPERMEQGAFHWYKFVSTTLTWPLMVGLGMLYIPMKDMVAAITLPYIMICTATVLSVVCSGFFVGKFMKMYPVEAAIVTACNSGMGGTGDVAILSAAGRMELMPFSQIATRIGGACMVVLATLLLKLLH